MRDADGWSETRERLRRVVMRKGPTQVAAEIPCGRTTLFDLLRDEDRVPRAPTQECIERLLDDEDYRSDRND